MNYKNEDEIKHALGIDSWRNLSKKKMIRFAAMMPDMDMEVALKIVEQFPVFKEFAMDAVDVMEKAHKSTLKSNKQSQEHFHQACKDIRDILRGELGKEDLDWEKRKFIIEQIQDTARLESQKDTENKRFLDGALNKMLAGAGAAIALGVVFVGGKIMADSKAFPGSSPDNHEGTWEA